MIKTVIFDADGTRVNSDDLHMEAWRAAAVYRDISELPYNYEQSPAAKWHPDAARGQRA